jgi:hypothetical protein
MAIVLLWLVLLNSYFLNNFTNNETRITSYSTEVQALKAEANLCKVRVVVWKTLGPRRLSNVARWENVNLPHKR